MMTDIEASCGAFGESWLDQRRTKDARSMPAGFLREVRLAQQLAQACDMPGLCELRVELKVAQQRAAAKGSAGQNSRGEDSDGQQQASADAALWAELRLRVDRLLGTWLTKNVKRGGRGSKSSAMTSKRGGASRRLPDGITKQAAANLRKLSGQSVDSFERYLSRCQQECREPTRAGAISAAAALPPVKASRAKPKPATDMPGGVVDLALRFMSRVDVLIGEAPGARPVVVVSRQWRSDDLRGSVLVTQPLDERQWGQLMRPGLAATEILVVAPFAMSDPAQLRAVRQGWQGVVLPEYDGWMLLYRGNRGRALRLMFAQSGLFVNAGAGA